MSIVLEFRTPPGKPVLRGHDHFWRVIRDLDLAGPWSIAAIRALTGGGIDRSTIRDFVKRLVAGGYAAELDDPESLFEGLHRPSPSVSCSNTGSAWRGGLESRCGRTGIGRAMRRA